MCQILTSLLRKVELLLWLSIHSGSRELPRWCSVPLWSRACCWCKNCKKICLSKRKDKVEEMLNLRLRVSYRNQPVQARNFLPSHPHIHQNDRAHAVCLKDKYELVDIWKRNRFYSKARCYTHFTWFTPVWVGRKREEVFQSLPLPSVVKDLQTQNLRVLWHGTNNTLQKEFHLPWPKVASFLHSLQVSWRWTLAKGSAETNVRKSNLEKAA